MPGITEQFLSMLEYFGQKVEPCGKCDYCRTVKKIKGETVTPKVSETDLFSVVATLLEEHGQIPLPELLSLLGVSSEKEREATIEALRHLADDGKISITGIIVSLP